MGDVCVEGQLSVQIQIHRMRPGLLSSSADGARIPPRRGLSSRWH